MKIKESKYKLIYNDLYRKIRSGAYVKGQQLPTEFQLVEEYGISRPTVAKALNDMQNEGLIERKVGVGTFVKDIPVDDSHKYLALLVPDIGRNEILEPLYSEIARSCEKEDYTLIWSGSLIGNREERIRQSLVFCEKYIKQKISGIFLYPSPDISIEHYQKMIELFQNAAIPVQILYQNLNTFPDKNQHDFVGIDSYSIGYRICRSLINQKATRPAICSEEDSPVLNQLLVKGFEEGARESGMETDHYYFTGNHTENQTQIQNIITKNTDALFCTSDSLAADIMTDLLEAGMDIPGQIQIAGFGNTRYAKHLKVSLSSLEIDWDEIGRMAVDLMSLRLKKTFSAPRQMLIDGQLIERESTLC